MNKVKKEVVIQNNTIEFGINEIVNIKDKENINFEEQSENLLVSFVLDLIQDSLKKGEY